MRVGVRKHRQNVITLDIERSLLRHTDKTNAGVFTQRYRLPRISR
jgi:hypothetical protein